MNNKPRWRSPLLLGLVFILVASVVGCGRSSRQDAEIRAYMAHADNVVRQGNDVALKVASLYKTADRLDASEIIERCRLYHKDYEDLLLRFEAVDPPQECLKLREYVADDLTFCVQRVVELEAYFVTGNVEHLDKADYYFNQSNMSILSAASEWVRLRKLVDYKEIPSLP